jgi:hypothetical protein
MASIHACRILQKSSHDVPSARHPQGEGGGGYAQAIAGDSSPLSVMSISQNLSSRIPEPDRYLCGMLNSAKYATRR